MTFTLHFVCTPHFLRSLVALDELGRGTATLDGVAIAGSVLQYMSHDIGCRCEGSVGPDAVNH